jgi:hypothetical protein
MKLYDLNAGDYFRLAGDPASPVFRIYKYLADMQVICYDKDGETLRLPGYSPVLRATEADMNGTT